ncbi:MAG: hypothetical protein ACLFN9_18225, partial [Desulfococcaceae bacterium]
RDLESADVPFAKAESIHWKTIIESIVAYQQFLSPSGDANAKARRPLVFAWTASFSPGRWARWRWAEKRGFLEWGRSAGVCRVRRIAAVSEKLRDWQGFFYKLFKML